MVLGRTTHDDEDSKSASPPILVETYVTNSFLTQPVPLLYQRVRIMVLKESSRKQTLTHDEMLDDKKCPTRRGRTTPFEDKHDQSKQLSSDQLVWLTLAPAKSNSCSTLPSQRTTLFQVTSKNEEPPPSPASLDAPPRPSTLPVERRWLCNDDDP